MRRVTLLFVFVLLAASCAFVRAQTPPASADDFFNSGLARQTKGDLDGAIADYSKAIELNPKIAEAYNNRGLARYDKEDFDGAIADYTKRAVAREMGLEK